MATTLRNEIGNKLLVHLTNALTDATQYHIYYSPKVDACSDSEYAPIRRAGAVLTLTPQNTPLLLEFAGSYRFENLTLDKTALIISMPVLSANYKGGDIMNPTAYTWDKNNGE